VPIAQLKLPFSFATHAFLTFVIGRDDRAIAFFSSLLYFEHVLLLCFSSTIQPFFVFQHILSTFKLLAFLLPVDSSSFVITVFFLFI
jgi:hypothetical protein